MLERAITQPRATGSSTPPYLSCGTRRVASCHNAREEDDSGGTKLSKKWQVLFFFVLSSLRYCASPHSASASHRQIVAMVSSSPNKFASLFSSSSAPKLTMKKACVTPSFFSSSAAPKLSMKARGAGYGELLDDITQVG